MKANKNVDTLARKTFPVQKSRTETSFTEMNTLAPLTSA